MKKYSVEGHEDSFLPDNADWKLVWQDEFDGRTLDETKWDYRLSMMNRRHEAWQKDCVHLDGESHAVFTLTEKDGKMVSSQLQTGYNYMDEPVLEEESHHDKDVIRWPIGKLKESKYLHSFGYYECRCRLQQHPDAWWTAFWIQSPIIGANLDPADSGSEIDIMECFDYGEIFPHVIFTGGYGPDRKRAPTGGIKGINQEEYHRFGVRWDETGYTFYVDGEENGHISEYVSQRPEFIIIGTEVKGYRQKDRCAVPEAKQYAGDTFVVDYIRVFDRV